MFHNGSHFIISDICLQIRWAEQKGSNINKSFLKNEVKSFKKLFINPFLFSLSSANDCQKI